MLRFHATTLGFQLLDLGSKLSDVAGLLGLFVALFGRAEV
jgi:hypothetical protein